MNVIEKDIIWSGHTFTLTNRRALYWKQENTLILSDLHVGKAAHFRKHGIPMSNLIHQHDLSCLESLIIHFNPTRIIFVGDLLHAAENSEVKELKKFLRTHALIEFILVRGNHDRLDEGLLTEMGIDKVCTNFSLGEVQFIHHSTKFGEAPQISGHLHPGVAVRLPPDQWRSFPAYVVSNNDLILPAFSHFTGTDVKVHIAGAVYHGVYDNGIFDVPRYGRR